MFALFLTLNGLSRAISEAADSSSGPVQVLAKAEKEYADGNYEAALDHYQGLLNTGSASGSLFYNMGNCYFAEGKNGGAILSYERARLFMPRDPGLIINLKNARSKMKQQDIMPREGFPFDEIKKAMYDLTSAETLLVFYIIYCLAVIMALLTIYARIFRPVYFIAAFTLFMISLACVNPVYDKLSYAKRTAVVISGIIDAKYEPRDKAESSFPLYEGMKISVIKSRKGWSKIMRPDGKVGWVETSCIEKIA